MAKLFVSAVFSYAVALLNFDGTEDSLSSSTGQCYTARPAKSINNHFYKLERR